MLQAGTIIGSYKLLNKLGQGASGVVWLAERVSSIASTKVAVKLPLSDEIDLKAVKQEAEVWVQASGHPNVLSIIEADVYDGQVVIVSEYTPDGTLLDWLNKYGGVAPSEAAAGEMMLGILSGLEFLHTRHILHRDLKPTNILLKGETPCLADFGVSRLANVSQKTTGVAGTPYYMAPEAFDGVRSVQTDVWAVGVMFYQIVAGRLPFAQKDWASLIYAIMHRDPEPLPAIVSQRIQTIVFKALHRDPKQRYGSAAEMKTDLLAALRYGSPLNLNVLNRTDEQFTVSLNPQAALATKIFQQPKNWSQSAFQKETVKIDEFAQNSIETKSANSRLTTSKILLSAAGIFAIVVLIVSPWFEVQRTTSGYSLIAQNTENTVAESSAETNVLSRNELFQQGEDALEKFDYEAALVKFQAILRDNPNDGEAYVRLGTCLKWLNRKEEETKAYLQAVKFIKPEDAGSYLNLGRAYNGLANYRQALKALEQALKFDPEPEVAAKIYRNIGDAHQHLDENREAINAYNQAVNVKPNGATYFEIGKTQRKLKNIEKAIEAYKQAAALRPESGEILTNLGEAYLNSGKYSEAAEVLQQAIKLNPKLPDAHFNLGLVYVLLKNKTGALEEYNRLKPLDDNRANLLFKNIHQCLDQGVDCS